ncbi:DUF2933 domain-containing protein [Wukongibacter baidiensis]|uniref:hypothetical protein n=1 Tax=Wukongibacter baidiensis TaxID=1723361 RepID=UPI003D7FB5C1
MQNMDRNTREMNREKDQKHKGMMKHGLMMMLCCLIPILLIAGLPLFGINGGVSSGLIFLLCPLMHIGMMFMMRKNGHKGSCHGDDKGENINVDSKE